MDGMFILSLWLCITCISIPFQCSKVFLGDRRSQMYTDKMCEPLHINSEFVPAEISGVNSGKGRFCPQKDFVPVLFSVEY